MSASEERSVPMSASEEPAAPPRFSNPAAAMWVALALVVSGALVGALWSVLAPGAHGVIADTKDNGRVHVYLGNEADNFFIAAMLLAGMVAVVAVVAAVAAWQWRAHRGPSMVIGLTLGSLAASATAAGVGAALARLRYGALDIAGAVLTDGHRIKYVVEAPAVFFGHAQAQVAVSLALAPFLAAATYAFCVVACARDDLGAWAPAFREPPVPAAVPPTAEDVTPSAS